MQPNKVTAVMKKPKKKMNIDANLNAELQRQAQENVAMQLGINGTNFSGLEETKESTAVGRRDLFRLPGEETKQARGPVRKPPTHARRGPNNYRGAQGNESSAIAALAAPVIGSDFNLSGTQIGGTPLLRDSSKTNMEGNTPKQGGGLGRSFRRPHSLNNRLLPIGEE